MPAPRPHLPAVFTLILRLLTGWASAEGALPTGAETQASKSAGGIKAGERGMTAAWPQLGGARLITIPGGTCAIGGKGHPTNPPRTVKLDSYQISDSETTNTQFAAFVAATGYKTDAERRGSAHIFQYGVPEWKWTDTAGACWKFPRGPKGPAAIKDLPQHPVTCLSAADAEACAAWAGGRLPTQAEWEVAARAGVITDFPWGAVFDPKLANTWDGGTHSRNSKADGWEFTAPVRSYPPNAWGLYDVIGNVFEFVSDLPVGIQEKPGQPLTSARGGSWWCSGLTCHAFNLLDNGTMSKNGSLPNQGFRVVFPVPTTFPCHSGPHRSSSSVSFRLADL